MSAHAIIHVALKALGIQGEDRRDVYERATGKRSLTEMSPREHQAVYSELQKLGFRPGSTGRKKRLDGRFAPKLQALWISAYHLGVTRSKDDAALIAFVRRQTGIEAVQWLRDAAAARKAIEALKSWITREAGVEWPTSDRADAQQRAVIAAQLRRLGGGAMPAEGADLKSAMAALGARIRARKAAA